MAFNMRDLRIDPGHQAHLHSIHVQPDQLRDLEQEGFMFGIKLSLNRRFLGLTSNFELFQSIDRCARGCLDEKGEWIENGVFYRRTFTLGRLKWYVSRGVIHDRTIVTCTIGNGGESR